MSAVLLTLPVLIRYVWGALVLDSNCIKERSHGCLFTFVDRYDYGRWFGLVGRHTQWSWNFWSTCSTTKRAAAGTSARNHGNLSLPHQNWRWTLWRSTGLEDVSLHQLGGFFNTFWTLDLLPYFLLEMLHKFCLNRGLLVIGRCAEYADLRSVEAWIVCNPIGLWAANVRYIVIYFCP